MNRVLVTGGTGSFGKAFIKRIANSRPEVERIVVFSRDELKQWELQQQFPHHAYPQLRFFLGDIRDRERIRRALEGIDTVVHAAALKQVPAAEYNPMEFINTNVIGAENLVQACLDSGVKRVVALSTDKAAAPVNLYGATKLCSDKLFIAANNIKGTRPLKFSVVRYGNVMGSRGSVVPYFIQQAKTGRLTLTDPEMTRFNITLDQGVDMVLWSIENLEGGEIVVPKIPSYRITDVADAIGPNCKQEIVGARPGEKVHEEMITSSDSSSTIDIGERFLVLPSGLKQSELLERIPAGGRLVEKGFSYNSGDNARFLSVSEIRTLIKQHIDPSFCPN